MKLWLAILIEIAALFVIVVLLFLLPMLTPRMPPASVEQWNHMQDLIERETPRAKGARPGIAHPIHKPAPATDRPALIV